jgi:K+-transporting ATPase ATPase C chain
MAAASLPLGARRSLAALRTLVVLTVVLGFAYPLAFTGLAQLVAGSRADGSFVQGPDGAVVGSSLLGQAFEGPEWFHPRPSAAGEGYDALASGASNLGPNSEDLLTLIEERRVAVAAANAVDPSQVPPDAVTASGSGLDPDISVEYANLQVARVAEARGLDASEVQGLVEESTAGRQLGFIGEPRVNVLMLNLALERLEG